MKFSCSQQTLSKSLNIVSKAVTARTTIPILKGILLKVNSDGTLTMSASDLDLGIEKTFEVENSEEGEIVVQAKLFGDIIRKLPNDVITIEDIEASYDNNIPEEMKYFSRVDFVKNAISNEFSKFDYSLIETIAERYVEDKF